MTELKPCPFCGGKARVLQRPDSLNGHFCAISCFCGGIHKLRLGVMGCLGRSHSLDATTRTAGR